VTQHGIRQLAHSVRQRAHALRGELNRLPEARPQPVSPGRLSAAQVRELARELFRHYTALLADYDQVVPELTVPVGREQRRPLRQLIEDRSCLSVGRWSVWVTFHLETSDDGRVGDTDAELPANSAKFLDDFSESLREAVAQLRIDLIAAVTDRLRELAHQTEPIRLRLAPAIGAEARTRLASLRQRTGGERRQKNIDALFDALRFAVNPADEDFFQRFRDAQLPPEANSLDPIQSYPLPGAAEHDFPRYFPWDAKEGRKIKNPGPHLVLVWRLRDALATGLRTHVQALGSDYLHRAQQALIAQFKEWTRNLRTLLGERELLACLAGEEAGVVRQTGWQVRTIPAPPGLD
jgi:hypothetical protein